MRRSSYLRPHMVWEQPVSCLDGNDLSVSHVQPNVTFIVHVCIAARNRTG